MNKAFLFDIDGVVVDSENVWKPVEILMLERVLGKNIASSMGDLTGLGISGVYEKARSMSSHATREELVRGYDECAVYVYSHAEITEGIDDLAKKLVALHFEIGFVTQSPHRWIDGIIERLPFKNDIRIVISLDEHLDLKSKPSPDGYLEALKALDADTRNSFVLEDSNPGIASAKAAGAYVIGFRGNLVPGYEQTGADAYADTMGEVAILVDRLAIRP